MADLSVIYYTANRERPEFEEKIKQNLLSTIGNLPLISVSQKPIDFGRNICVGDVGASSQNAFRQFQIGAVEAKTRFVCPAEADFLYPREYFDFRPEREDTFYIASPLYVLFAMRGKARVFCLKPRGSEAAGVVGRNCLIETIESMLDGYGMWGMAQADGSTFPYLLRVVRRERFHMSIPSITFKTDNNMHRKTPHDSEGKVRELPHWGTAIGLIRRYL